MRLVSARSRVRSSLEAVRVGVVGNISACHADAPGSIPGRGVFFSSHELGRRNPFFFIKRFFCFPTAKSFVHTSNASIAQLAEHLLRKEKVTTRKFLTHHCEILQYFTHKVQNFTLPWYRSTIEALSVDGDLTASEICPLWYILLEQRYYTFPLKCRVAHTHWSFGSSVPKYRN